MAAALVARAHSVGHPPYLIGRAVGFIAVSDSQTFSAMANPVHELRAWLAPPHLTFDEDNFNADLTLSSGRPTRRLERLVDELLDFAAWARSKQQAPHASVREMRTALTVSDFERAVSVYRDGMGLPVVMQWATPEGREAVLEAGRATLEIVDNAQADLIDSIVFAHDKRER